MKTAYIGQYDDGEIIEYSFKKDAPKPLRSFDDFRWVCIELTDEQYELLEKWQRMKNEVDKINDLASRLYRGADFGPRNE